MSLHPFSSDISYQKERKMIIDAVQAGAISDIFDIKACNIIWYHWHQILPQKSHGSRLPTNLLYRIPKLRRRARASALFGNSERKSSWEKKSGKRRTREPLYAKNDSRITEEKIFYFSWILIKILTKIQKRAIIMSDFSDNNRICRYVPILRLLRRGYHISIIYNIKAHEVKNF